MDSVDLANGLFGGVSATAHDDDPEFEPKPAAAVLDGMNRQTLRDCVHWPNAQCPYGLLDD